MPSSLLCLLTILTSSYVAKAAILPFGLRSVHALVERQCARPCGYYGQVCCGPNESCFTDSKNQAQCGPNGAPANVAANQADWQYYTTTYVETDRRTITTTFSSYFPVATQNQAFTTVVAGPTGQCKYSMGEVPCDAICCSSGQYCKAETNECIAVDGDSSAYYSSQFSFTQVASVAVRPTSNTILTVTSTGAATTTVPFSAPIATDGSSLIGAQATTQSSSLSPGAIAGIVIGVIIGIILLTLICLCCCARGLLNGILGIFGGGKKTRRTEKTTYINQRHSHHGSRAGGRTWFGSRPARVDRTEPKKKSGLGDLVKVGAGLGVLGTMLGIKRKRDRRHEEKSNSDYSYYDSSYGPRTRSTSSSKLIHYPSPPLSVEKGFTNK
jgi:hypothetical protein